MNGCLLRSCCIFRRSLLVLGCCPFRLFCLSFSLLFVGVRLLLCIFRQLRFYRGFYRLMLSDGSCSGFCNGFEFSLASAAAVVR